MALQGDLKYFSLVELFNLLNLNRKTGMLAIERNKQTASLYFQEGRLLYALIPGQTVALDQVLLQAGKISPAQANEVKQGGTWSDKALAVRLVDFGILSQDEIVQQLRTRIIESVYSLFTWQDGPFRFETNVALPDAYIAVPIRLEGIIIEGSRRIQEWDKLNQQLPDLNVVVKMVQPGGNGQARQINLTIDEWRIVPLISEGRSTIAEIARQHSMDEYKIRKIMYRLMAAGLVEVVKPETEHRKPGGLRVPFSLGREQQTQQQAQPVHQQRNLVLRLIDRIRGI